MSNTKLSKDIEEKVKASFFKRFKEMKPVIIATTIVIAIVAIMSFISDLIQVNQGIYDLTTSSNEIEAEFMPSGSVPEGTAVTFVYKLPDTGYYSLWNQNSTGAMIRRKPEEAHLPSYKLYEKEKPYTYDLKGNQANSLEHIIILWSDNPNHPPLQRYNKWNDFKNYLDTHHYDWKVVKKSLQVI